ncbi:hypothetical protein [Carnobacterium divergens]|uniref:hypothetical protein n=1 Tax=Carnobacterium divergens TaxID=2748 RepID=UPI0039B08409
MKNNLSLFEAKLSEISIANVTIPKTGKIQFVKKMPRYNGNQLIEGSCAKIRCEFIDLDLAKVLEKSNVDTRQLKTTTLEIIGDEFSLIDISEDELLGNEISLIHSKVMLKWDTRSAGWNGLKLVLDLADLTEGSE